MEGGGWTPGDIVSGIRPALPIVPGIGCAAAPVMEKTASAVSASAGRVDALSSAQNAFITASGLSGITRCERCLVNPFVRGRECRLRDGGPRISKFATASRRVRFSGCWQCCALLIRTSERDALRGEDVPPIPFTAAMSAYCSRTFPLVSIVTASSVLFLIALPDHVPSESRVSCLMPE